MGEILQPGTKAPDFNAPVTPDQRLSLGDLKGRRVILAFYPADWSPVCGDQMALYNAVLPEFRKHGADLIGISVDGAWCHQAYAKANQLHFPLISDFHPKGAIAKSFGAYREDDGVADRALFILDEGGTSSGAIVPRSRSTPARTAFSTRSRRCPSSRLLMAELRFPIRDDDHVIGLADAPVTLVEYGDYQCPHCQAAWPQVEQVLRHFGRDIRYAYRHFPNSTVHPVAKPAAECAEFAGAHGQFWEMHSAIYANGHQLSGAVLLTLASQLRLDVAELRNALVQGTYAGKVEADFLSGVRSGVNGTPCFFINGQRHEGSYAAPALIAAISAVGRKAPVRKIEIRS